MRTRIGLALAVIPCLLTALGCTRAAAPLTNEGQRSAAGVPATTDVAPTAPAPLSNTAPTDDGKGKDLDMPMASAAPPAEPTPPPPVAAKALTPSPVPTVAASPPPSAADVAALSSGAGRGISGGGGGHGVAARSASPAKPTAAAAAADPYAGPGATAWAPPAFNGVKAGEWDDNANYREFQRFLGATQVTYHPVDLRFRRFLVVRDAQGKPIPRCQVHVNDEQQHGASFLTTAGGHAILFPKGEGLNGRAFTAVANCAEGTASTSFALTDDNDGVVDLHLQKERNPIATRTVDLAFVLDTTGSMSEEIAAVTQTIQKVAEQLQTSETRVRIGMVEYKDRSDPFVTKVYPMTQDLKRFAATVSTIQASGGGDTPEDMNAGLHDALTKLQWSDESVARVAFVIADAPPHLDYQGPDYAVDMKNAAHRGIQLFTVAASGMDMEGQVVMRQMAQYTGGTNMFVLRGGAGPQSTGGGDPGSSCGGTHQNYASGNLHELIVSKIKHELRSIDGDPMRIAGLRTDENAKPCDQRVVWLD